MPAVVVLLAVARSGPGGAADPRGYPVDSAAASAHPDRHQCDLGVVGFHQDNGATRILPGSHKYASSPEYGKAYDAATATMPAGSVMLFDSALWHGGGANTSDARRFALSCSYCWGWMRQQENLQLGIPRETAERFPRRLQELCGYSVYKGQFGHIDNRDPIELLGRERGKRMVWEATDAKKARMGGQ